MVSKHLANDCSPAALPPVEGVLSNTDVFQCQTVCDVQVRKTHTAELPFGPGGSFAICHALLIPQCSLSCSIHKGSILAPCFSVGIGMDALDIGPTISMETSSVSTHCTMGELTSSRQD